MPRTQVRVTLPASLQKQIATVRERWNPERALTNPAHATVIYHDEAPNPELLIARLRAAAKRTKPFRLHIGGARRFPDPVRGAFLEVSDSAGVVAALRERILVPPFSERGRFGLHITILHPDQGDRLEAAWNEIASIPQLPPFEVSSLQVIGANSETQPTVDLSAD